MVLPRRTPKFSYGSLHQLFEAREDHKGYGDVTWNVGPHAGPNPYPGRKIAFVDKNRLMAGYAQHPADEVERRANEIAQLMNRGEVIHVPHISMTGGRPNLTLDHAAAIHAATKAGADRIPVAYHPDDMFALNQAAGTLERPGAALPKQDPRFNWRWNGRGWYTKPSFNQGNCPAGAAVAPGDRCVASGGAQDPAVVQKAAAPPAAANAAAGGAPVPPAPPAPPPAPPSPPPPPAAGAAAVGTSGRRIVPRPVPVGTYLDRSQIPGAPVKLPVGYGLAHDILDNRMDDAIGKKGMDLDADIPTESPTRKSNKQVLRRVRAEMRARFPDTFRPGSVVLGAGAAGAVFAGPRVNGMDTVYKYDLGPYEARMVHAIQQAGLIGDHGLSILPRYISAHETSVKMSRAQLPVHVIHREDLANVDTTLSEDEKYALDHIGIGYLHSLSAMAKPAHMGGSGMTRDEIVDHYDRRLAPKMEAIAQRAGGQLSQQWSKISSEIRKMLEHGVVPCDLHASNWGIRKGTGDIVMRDVGCSTVVDR